MSGSDILPFWQDSRQDNLDQGPSAHDTLSREVSREAKGRERRQRLATGCREKYGDHGLVTSYSVEELAPSLCSSPQFNQSFEMALRLTGIESHALRKLLPRDGGFGGQKFPSGQKWTDLLAILGTEQDVGGRGFEGAGWEGSPWAHGRA